MGIAGGFARHGPKAKALAGVESGRLQPVVVKAERFGLAVFQVQFPVVGALQRLIHSLLHPVTVHAGAGEEKIVVGHGSLRMRGCAAKSPAKTLIGPKISGVAAVPASAATAKAAIGPGPDARDRGVGQNTGRAIRSQ